jgi:hypothetical protein
MHARNLPTPSAAEIHGRLLANNRRQAFAAGTAQPRERAVWAMGEIALDHTLNLYWASR